MKSISGIAVALGYLVSALSAQVQIKQVPMSGTNASEGNSMYSTYCAVCHGSGGKSDGLATPALKELMPDLTLLSKNNEGAFPSHRLMQTLELIWNSGAHGSAEMPIWGILFRASGQREADMQLRVYNPTRLLEGLQVAIPAKAQPQRDDSRPLNLSGIRADSGSDMYRILCAGCHGSDGKGDGPASPTLKGEKLALTHLTKQNNGEFPSQRLARILGNQVNVQAHGSKEMPIWGESFRGVGEPNAVVQLRIRNPLDYLKRLQQD